MSNIAFWQTVAAIVVANTLCALSLHMAWRVAKAEKGRDVKPGVWVYVAGLLSPAVVIAASITLP